MSDIPHSFQVAVRNPVPVNGPLPTHLPADAALVATLRRPSARPEEAPLARVYASPTAQHASEQNPLPARLHLGSSDGGSWCSVHPVAPDVYDVQAADGAILARVTRRSARLLPWPRRVRWSARLTGPPRSVTARVGTWYAWLAYVATAPVWILLALCGMAYSFFDGTADDHTFRSPSRTRWRAPGTGTVLDRRGISKTYRFAPRHLDVRIAYALAVLQTWEPSPLPVTESREC
ncbi:hypothetical protein HG826_31800 [Streptomyces sp. GMY01]|uniref:hypothetical protein n=1 Tax=Streptomyces sp. GMY02 TaxID=1333528 RepID=UPI00146AF554|nr:hypothetical protein [Streptomyces sp. GMY02]NMO38090.1 hypothetical protein [Streptomyces sp. GMY02]